MLNPGTILQDRYRIFRQLGGGGMGVVYLAEDIRLSGRLCAVKEMSPEQVAVQDRQWATNAFRQEAEILARLQHPGIAAVTDFFPEGGNWYLVMEYVQGQTLSEVLETAPGKRLPEAQALGIFDQLVDVLTFLHTQSPPVVFRDLKPGNVMITPEGKVKLIDFGIARFFKPTQGRDTVNLGTPGYAAPEQYGGQGQSDVRADVYGLGVMLHQMLTGHDPTHTPFRLPPLESLAQGLPPHVAQAVRQATDNDPQARFPSVAHFRATLRASSQTEMLTEGRPPSTAGTPRWVLGLVGAGVVLIVLAVVAVGAFMVLGNKPEPTPTSSRVVARATATDKPVETLTPPPTVVVVVTATPDPDSIPNAAPATVVVVVTATSPPDTLTPTPTEEPDLPSTLTGDDGAEMILIPEGEFIRGSTRDQVDEAVRLCNQGSDNDPCTFDEFANEMPQREITLSAFYIDRTEVTNAQFESCVRAGDCSRPGTGGRQGDYYGNSRYDNYPVINVSWYDADAYCRWADKRLPTEAEWEKVARGEQGNIWPWGDSWDSSRANTDERGPNDLTRVGSYSSGASPYGVLDLSGNVWEWVQDRYDDDYYASAPDTDPPGPSSGSRRVVKGGGWSSFRHYVRAANRGSKPPNDPSVYTGFRCAADLP